MFNVVSKMGVVHTNTLRELSAQKPTKKRPGSYAYEENNADFVVVDFEEWMSRYYPKADGYLHYPARCDGFYENLKGDLFLIEFKAGNNLEPLELHRKMYDSIIALIKFANQSFDVFLQHGIYLVIKKSINDSKTEKLLNRNFDRINRPWNVKGFHSEDYDLYKQDGVMVRKAFLLSPKHLSVLVEDWKCEIGIK